MTNKKYPIPEGSRVLLSGVVTTPNNPNCFASWKEILISSFVETRFKNVLARATVLRRANWFWHSHSSLHLCEGAVALVADNTNDYRQILIKQNHLTSTLQDLDEQAEVLLLVSPLRDFVFGTVLESGEMFSTHILFVQQKQYNRGATVPECLGHNSPTVAQSNSNAAKPTSKVYANSAGGCI